MVIRTEGPWFRDELGRTVLLHGVNLGGSSKVPACPNGATHILENFFQHREVSFVGRPFPLSEADEHFQRLKSWGLTLLRFIVTWEAVEHAGPGIYDEAYLDYLHEIIRKSGEYGFQVIIDPHQDVWSRFSGGDGAPGWTLEAVGFDLTQFQETGAAIVHQLHGDPFPMMIWPTNGSRLAAATMFTLFFGGNDFAPQTTIEGEPVQEYLQRHYIGAYQQVACKLKDLPCVIGFEVMNEPMNGFIGVKDLTKPTLPVKIGALLTPLQSMLLGSGIPQEIEIWQRNLLLSRLVERRRLNTNRMRIWREGYDGIWCQNGVWSEDAKGGIHLERPHHFWQVNGKEVDFSRDYMRPFTNRFAHSIRKILPDALIFFETDPRLPPPEWGSEDADHIVYAPHWYDATVLFLKTFSPWIGFNIHKRRIVLGRGSIRRSFAWQLNLYKEYAKNKLGNVPVLIGEIGIAYDLNNCKAYRTGNFKHQIRAMNRSLRATEDELLSFTIWNYTADNDQQHGDQWNGEDLSIFSRDQQTDPTDLNSGGRALEAVVRPFPRATAGTPLQLSFDHNRRTFTYEFSHTPGIEAPTEIFVPTFQYPHGYNVWVTDGECKVLAQDQVLLYRHETHRKTHRIRITPRAAE